MKKLITLSIVILMITSVFAQEKAVLNGSANTLELISSNDEGLVVQNSIQTIDFRHVKTSEGVFIQMLKTGYIKTDDIGNPELKAMKRLIEIPYNANITVKIVSFSEEIIDLNSLGYVHKIIPCQASMFKDQNPEDVEFIINEDMYNGTSSYEPELVKVTPLSKMRGVRVARLEINPFRYDASSNTLTVFNNLVVEISFKNADITATNTAKEKYYSPTFEKMYNRLLNYSAPSSKNVTIQYPIKYVIVSDPMFEEALQPFIEWKTKKGFYVIEAYTDDIGTSVNDIKSYLQGLYEAGTAEDPAPTYVLFCGDIAQIPATNTGAHVTDMYTVEFDGDDDYIPEMYFGRFSATSVAQIEVEIEKTLMFEEYTFPDPSFLEEVVLVAGDDNTYGPTHANGQINYATTYYFNEDHDVTSHTYLYPNSNGQASDIISDISDGVAFVNYTAHCGSSGWAGPSFTNGDIPGLQNDNEYFFSIGNCCLSNKFDDASCFGETLIRTANKGAVIHIGGTNSTLWDEDFYWSAGIASSINANTSYEETSTAAYDHLFHENGEDTYASAYEIAYIGNMAVMESSSTQDKYYWEIYSVMGDPSLMPYVGVPSQLDASYFTSLPIGSSELTVTTEANAYVAISVDGVLLDAKVANESGIAILEFDAFTSMATADVVATKQFRAPYIGTCSVIPNDNNNDAMMKTIVQPISLINVANATFQPEVEIMNLGQINLTSVDVVYVLNENAPVEIEWEGDLDFMSSESVLFPEITLTEGVHNFTFYVNNPNGTIDEYPANNELTREVTVYSGDVTLVNIVAPEDLYCNESEFAPQITIENNDATPLTSLICSYTCGSTNDEFTWTGNLAQGETTSITFPSNTFEIGSLTIDFLITDPNSGTDMDESDNTASKSFLINNPGQEVEMILVTDGYASETTWELVHDQSGNTLYSDGPWGDDEAFTFTENWCLGDGCFTFTIFDSYGDGMSGSWWQGIDPGSVTITNVQTEEVYWELEGDDNDFVSNDEASVTFCIEITGITKNMTTEMKIYPNPANETLHINTIESITKLNIYNMLGELTYSVAPNSNNVTINVSQFAEGVYTIRTEFESTSIQNKVIITK